MAQALTGPATVLPLLLVTLTDKGWLVGIGSSMYMAGWFLPQIFGARIISRRTYRLPWYRLMGLFRTLCMGGMALFTLTMGGDHSDWLLVGFLLMITCYAVSGGLAGVAFLDIVGKDVPAVARGGVHGRGSFFGWRISLGGVMAIAVGFLVVNPVLAGVEYPDNFATLFGLATLTVAAGVLVFSLVRESPSVPFTGYTGLREHLRESFRLVVTDRPFRRYFILRNLTTLWTLGTPFYILFARSRFDLTPFWVGAFLASRSAGEMCFNLLWAYLSDRGRNRLVLRGAALLTLATPLAAFAQLIWGLPEPLYALVFFTAGGAVSGMMLGGSNYLLQHAPANKRPLYIGVMNSTLGVTMLSAGVGGLVVDHFGFPVLFGIVTVIAVISIVSASRLDRAGG